MHISISNKNIPSLYSVICINSNNLYFLFSRQLKLVLKGIIYICVHDYFDLLLRLFIISQINVNFYKLIKVRASCM